MTKIKKDKRITFFTRSKAPVDFILLLTVVILLATGIIMVLSASSPTALAEFGDSYTYLYKQCLCAAIGLVVMFILTLIDYRVFKRLYKLVYIATIAVLCLVFIFGISENGATRWVYIGPISFQPSEVAKVGIILFYAELLTRKKDKLKNFKEGILYSLIWLIPIVLLVFGVQNHLSATIVICFLAVFLMFMAGCKISHFIIIGVILAAVGIPALFMSKGGFRLNRIMSFANPGTDISGTEWQTNQSLYAIGSGGIFGVGLGNSKQKYLYLPEPHNDFIFAVIAEELGFVGCSIILILFAIFIWRGIVIAMKSKDMFGSLVAIGITSLVAVEVIINVAVVSNLMPVTGMSLPFISYGGTSIIVMLAAIGILLNISKVNNEQEK